MSEFDVYWILKLNDIKALLIIAGFILIIVYMRFYALSEEMNKTVTPYVLGICFGAILLITGIMVPSTKELCAIKVVPKIVNSSEFDTIKKDLGEVYTIGIEHIKTTLSNKEEK